MSEQDKKIDKRTKEYRDMIKQQEAMQIKNTEDNSVVSVKDGLVVSVEESSNNSTEVEMLKKELADMKNLINKIGKATLDNAENIKNTPTVIHAQPAAPAINKQPRPIVYPRFDEWKVLNKFLQQHVYMTTGEKGIQGALGLFLQQKRVADILYAISQHPKLREEALAQGITKDFKTAIVPDNKD